MPWEPFWEAYKKKKKIQIVHLVFICLYLITTRYLFALNNVYVFGYMTTDDHS